MAHESYPRALALMVLLATLYACGGKQERRDEKAVYRDNLVVSAALERAAATSVFRGAG